LITRQQNVIPMLSEHELEEIRALIERRAGLLFDQSRDRFFHSRIREHMTCRKLVHGQDLLRILKTSNLEYEALLETLLTQETSFFRYPHVFEALEKRVLPEIHVKKFWENPRTLRLWCAGCATGEEAYSIAITLAEALDFTEGWNLQILATDISRRALEHAERGVYSRRALGELTPKQVESHFAKVGDQFLIKPRIRNMVTFVPMNLVDGVYLRRYDAIFCMNVLIYFSDEQRVGVIQRLHDSLEPGGYMFLGHAESIAGVNVKFESVVHRDARLYLKPMNGTVRFASSIGVGEESV